MTYFRSLGPQSISAENNTLLCSSRPLETVLEQRETIQTQGQLWPSNDLQPTTPKYNTFYSYKSIINRAKLENCI